MSERKIHGFTISINGEHEDDDGYARCNKCNTKVALVYPIGEWIMDSEPYKNGEVIEDRAEMDVGEVSGHWCDQCDRLTSLSYNFA